MYKYHLFYFIRITYRYKYVNFDRISASICQDHHFLLSNFENDHTNKTAHRDLTLLASILQSYQKFPLIYTQILYEVSRRADIHVLSTKSPVIILFSFFFIIIVKKIQHIAFEWNRNIILRFYSTSFQTKSKNDSFARLRDETPITRVTRR